LEAYQSEAVFNPYRDREPSLDRPDGPAIRRRNLRTYLTFFAQSDYVLVGEAPGYAGCRFSGIPFTSEAQIVGPERLAWTSQRDHLLAQSSLESPWQERSAHMVWQALSGRTDCVLWNAFPWHPFADTPLSNRKPKAQELRQGHRVLRLFLGLFPQAQVYAIGRVSQGVLAELGVSARYIRHPSHGGKAAFTQGVQDLPCKLGGTAPGLGKSRRPGI
jgi:hypothetical protein